MRDDHKTQVDFLAVLDTAMEASCDLSEEQETCELRTYVRK